MRSGAFLYIVVAALLIAGAGRLVYLEQTDGAVLRETAERQQTAALKLPARRGDILDSRGRVLAGTVRRPSVFADVTQITDFAFDAASVAAALDLDAHELEHRLLSRSERQFVWVKRLISEDELAKFEAVKKNRGLAGFGVQYEPKRDYPLGPLAAQVLGFVNSEDMGLAGIEQEFNTLLRGADGKRLSTVDSMRRRVRSREDSFVPPQDGASIVLTIDAHVQQRAELHLREAVEEFKAQWGTMVVMDPQTGEVLAMATWPTFDPTQPIPLGLDEAGSKEAAEHLRNRAISDSYEPGSIFKPFIAAPAIESGFTRLDETFTINGPTRNFGGRTIHDTHAYDVLTLHEVISKSSNIGMGMLGARCGNERLNEYVRAFGFGDITGIQLPGEHPGLLQRFSRWTNYSTQSIPIGQEVAVTPLQIAAAFSVYCNGGVLMRPRVVRGVVGPDGRTIEDDSRPVAIRRVLSEDTVRRFREAALVECVNTGTGKRAHLDGYQVFGKTGTAQVAASEGGGYIAHAYTGSFMAGAPARDPCVAVLVSLHRPSGGSYYGGTVAAPAAAAIIADVLEYMQVPPDNVAAESDAVGQAPKSDESDELG